MRESRGALICLWFLNLPGCAAAAHVLLTLALPFQQEISWRSQVERPKHTNPFRARIFLLSRRVSTTPSAPCNSQARRRRLRRRKRAGPSCGRRARWKFPPPPQSCSMLRKRRRALCRRHCARLRHSWRDLSFRDRRRRERPRPDGFVRRAENSARQWHIDGRDRGAGDRTRRPRAARQGRRRGARCDGDVSPQATGGTR